MSKTLVLKPHVSEKAYGLAQTNNVYVFEVPKGASKHLIAQAVTAQFEVTVRTVNVTNIKGKTKRTVRKGGRPVAGRQNDVRKAYVTIKEGDSIPVFKATEEDQKPEPAAKSKATKEKK